MLNWDESKQGTIEWFKARAGVITGSKVEDARKMLKTGKPSSERIKYSYKLAVERIAGSALDAHEFSPWQAKRGQELEDDARQRHEREAGEFILEAGFAYTEDRKFGASVDGLIGDDGILEIKCFLDPVKLVDILVNDDIGDVMAQIQWGLWVTHRKWCDFVLYCPQLEAAGLGYKSIRFERDEDYIERLVSDMVEFDKAVEEVKLKLLSKGKDKWVTQYYFV